MKVYPVRNTKEVKRESKISNGVYRIIFILFAICYLPFAICFAQDITKGEELFFIAQEAFQKGYYEVSIGYLEKFLKQSSLQSPFYLEAGLLTGVCYFYQGKYSQAFEKFQRLSELPESAQIKDTFLYWMAECYFKENEFQKAKDYYSKIIKDFPNSKYLTSSLYSLGWSLFSERNFKEAYNIFQKFLEKFPQDKLTPKDFRNLSGLIEDAHFKIIECLYNLKDYLKLKQNIDSYLTKYPETKNIDFLFLYRAEALFYVDKYLEAIDCYQKVISNCPDINLKNLAQLGMGFAYLKLNEDQKAYEEFSQLIELGADEELILQAHLGKAEALYNMDRYSESKEIYIHLKELSQDKNSGRIHYGLGLCLLKEKDFSQAREEFCKVPLKSSIYPEAIYLSGICLYNLNKYKEALSIFEDILKELKPNEKLVPRIEFYISDCLFRIGDKVEALSRFKNLRIKYPGSEIAPEVLYWLADYYYKEKMFRMAARYFNAIIYDYSESKITASCYYHLGKIFLEQENYLAAIDLFSKAIEEDKDLEILILPEIALGYRNLGLYEEAISSLKKAIELSNSAENSCLWRFRIAEILEEQKRFDEAISEYLKVPQDSKLSPKALLRIAKIYEDKEKWIEAENFYQRVLNLDIQEAKFAKEKLEEIATAINAKRR